MSTSRYPFKFPTLAGLLALAALLVIPGFLATAAETPEQWWTQGQDAVKAARRLQPVTRPAQNVILFVGDGMGLSTVTAARIFEGQRQGKSGEEHRLSFERLPYVALAKTYSTNQQVPDSAAAMTAMVTGFKTKDGVLSLNGNVTPKKASTVPGTEVRTLFEWAEQKGLATGLVTTTRVTHATPAACYAHSPHRGWECDADITAEDPANAQFPDIARQLVEFPYGDGLEVVLGGGRDRFLPQSLSDPEYPGKRGKRRDGRNLTQEWLNRHPQAAYVWNKAQFDAVDPQSTKRLLGLFEPSHLSYETDRSRDAAGEPSLSDMTAKAIAILSRNPKGFVLMVEGGRIDHAHHDNNAHRALTDTVELDRAVALAREKTNPQETLIMVTADHGHVLALAGYPTRGNPILGKVRENDAFGNPAPELARDQKGLPYTTLIYGNGPGHRQPRPDLSQINTEDPDYRQEAAVPLKDDTHSGEDVPLYAGGPGAHLFHGVLEQHAIFHLMVEAMQMNNR
jgi:alkaline phosphatase